MAPASCLVIVALLLISQISKAKEIVVGNQAGWTNYDLRNFKVPNYGAWAVSQRAVVGDHVVFRYARGLHNVNLLPNLAAYKSCDFSRAKRLDNGESGTYIWRATAPGVYFFGCNKVVEAEGNHCGSGQKFSLVVRAFQTSNEGDDELEVAVSAAMTPGASVSTPPVSAPSATPPALSPPILSPVNETPSTTPTSPPSVRSPPRPPVMVSAPSNPPTKTPASSPVASAPLSPPSSIPPANKPTISAPAAPPTSPASLPSVPPAISSVPPTNPPFSSPAPQSSPPAAASPSSVPTSPTSTLIPPSTARRSSPPSVSSPVSSPGTSPITSVASPPAPPLSSGTSVGIPGPTASGASTCGRLVAAVMWGYLIAVAAKAALLL